jgi:ribonucleotide reductase alpha subunit
LQKTSTAREVSMQDQLKMQAALQPFVDSTTAKTVALPDDFPASGAPESSRIACRPGLKGCTLHRRMRPRTRRTNVKAERFIRSTLREWACARACRRSYQRIAALPRWLHGYNSHRPHTSLAGQPPITQPGSTRK